MTSPVQSAAPGAGGVAAASAAAARVAELRSMIQTVEDGPEAGSFGAALDEASAVGGQAGATPALAEASALPTATATASSAAPIASTATTASPLAAGEAGGPVPYAAQIEAACAKYGVEPALLAGVIEQESHFDPSAGSPAGAQGLTQLMPETARGLGVTNPYDPAQAIEGGARLLGEKLAEFGGDTELALAAYNAGSGAVHQYHGIPPYAETQEYVQKVLGYAAGYAGAFGGAP